MRRFPPYIFISENTGRRIVVTGRKALTMSDEDFAKFRPLSLLNATSLISTDEIGQKNQVDTFQRWASELDLLEPIHSKRKSYSSSEFESACTRALSIWRAGITSASLSRLVPKRAAATAYLIEVAWYVQHVPYVIEYAREHARSAKSKRILHDFYRAESDHCIGLCADLRITPEELLKHDPAPGAVALVALLKELATEDELLFLVACATLEADVDNAKLGVKFLQKLSRLTKLDLTNFIDHIRVDAAEAHVDLWKSISRERKEIPKQLADRAINLIHQIRHAHMMWLESIAFRCAESIEVSAHLNVREPRSYLRRAFAVSSFSDD